MVFYARTYLLPFCVSSLKDFATHIDLTSWSLNRMVYLFYVYGLVIEHLITLIMGYKRQGPKYQYWKSLILGQILVLASLRRLLFLKHTNYPLDKW